jgi:hypothetical protein
MQPLGDARATCTVQTDGYSPEFKKKEGYMQRKIMMDYHSSGVGSHGDQPQVSLWTHRKDTYILTRFYVADEQQRHHYCILFIFIDFYF